MFKVLVLACQIHNPASCLILENQRFPIDTREACEARAMEMAADVHKFMEGWQPQSWRCELLRKGTLT